MVPRIEHQSNLQKTNQTAPPDNTAFSPLINLIAACWE
jgi:hypothetical protein